MMEFKRITRAGPLELYNIIKIKCFNKFSFSQLQDEAKMTTYKLRPLLNLLIEMGLIYRPSRTMYAVWEKEIQK